MFALFECAHGPLEVQLIGKGNIDRIDFAVVEQVLIARVDASDSKLLADCAGLFGIARRESEQRGARSLLECRHHFAGGDRSGAEYTPGNGLTHSVPQNSKSANFTRPY